MYTEVNEEVIQICEDNNYRFPKLIEGQGVCVIAPFLYTTAIVVGLTDYGYRQRYCYPNELVNEALIEFSRWDGVGHPKGQWIKSKGEMEFENPDFPFDETHPNWVDQNSEESLLHLVKYVRSEWDK